jgi:ADP-heptose:LPS heptosyltransferase
MNVKLQLFFDKGIAKPLAFLLNYSVQLVGKILRINHDLNRSYKTIVVSKFKGMGSIIQATPMLMAISSKYPGAKLVFVSSKANQQILEKITCIDELVLVDDRSIFQFIKTNITSLYRLIRMRPELFIDLEVYSDYSTLFTLATLSTNRVGYYLRSSSFRTGIYTHMMFFNPRVPISKVYLQTAALIGCDIENESLFPIHQNLPHSSERKPYIVINPNASDLRVERKWGTENFVNFINRFSLSHPTTTIYLIGSPAEVDYTTEIFSALNVSNVINLAGKTSIDELIVLIAEAQLMLSNDTGPMHIAFATKTPILCLFGPCSPDQYGKSANAKILYKKVYCSPCVHDFEVPPCKGNNSCMQLIQVDEVLAEFEAMFQGETKKKDENQDFIYSINENVLGKVYR